MIRLAERKDLDKIMEIIHQASQGLKEQKIHQWQDGYPDEAVILSDIALKQCYVADEGEIIGVMVCSFEKDENYNEIAGQWVSNDEAYATIHRIAVHKDSLRKHVGMQLYEEAIKQCKKRNVQYIRIDTHPKNRIMQKFIEKQNFIKCGIILVKREKIEPERYAYEKLI